MKQTLMGISILAIALALSPVAVADTLVGTSGYGWQDWSTGDLNQNGVPYWDRTSFDSGKKNIGFCLTGTGDCTVANYPAWADRPGSLPYWGQSISDGGGADSSFYMNRSGTGNQTALKIEIAGNFNSNRFGWYDTTNQAAYASNVIYGAGASGNAPAAAFFAPTATYGFWFEGDQGVYFSESRYNSQKGSNISATGLQQFAIFQQSAGSYWLGMEDRHNRADFDYNDMVIHVSQVPDGGMTLTLLGVALIGLELVRRRIWA